MSENNDQYHILFRTLLKDPAKKKLVLDTLFKDQHLIKSSEDINKRLVHISKLDSPQRKRVIKNGMSKVRCESPSALKRRRELELLNNPKPSTSNKSKNTAKFLENNKQKLVPHNELLKGVNAYVEIRTKNGDRSAGAKILMQSMGATISEKLCRDVTHIIYKDGTYNTYLTANLLRVPLTSILWLEAVRDLKIRLPEGDYPALCSDDHDKDLSAVCQDLQQYINEEPYDPPKEKNRKRQTVHGIAMNSSESATINETHNTSYQGPSTSLQQSCGESDRPISEVEFSNTGAQRAFSKGSQNNTYNCDSDDDICVPSSFEPIKTATPNVTKTLPRSSQKRRQTVGNISVQLRSSYDTDKSSESINKGETVKKLLDDSFVNTNKRHKIINNSDSDVTCLESSTESIVMKRPFDRGMNIVTKNVLLSSSNSTDVLESVTTNSGRKNSSEINSLRLHISNNSEDVSSLNLRVSSEAVTLNLNSAKHSESESLRLRLSSEREPHNESSLNLRLTNSSKISDQNLTKHSLKDANKTDLRIPECVTNISDRKESSSTDLSNLTNDSSDTSSNKIEPKNRYVQNSYIDSAKPKLTNPADPSNLSNYLQLSSDTSVNLSSNSKEFSSLGSTAMKTLITTIDSCYIEDKRASTDGSIGSTGDNSSSVSQTSSQCEKSSQNSPIGFKTKRKLRKLFNINQPIDEVLLGVAETQSPPQNDKQPVTKVSPVVISQNIKALLKTHRRGVSTINKAATKAWKRKTTNKEPNKSAASSVNNIKSKLVKAPVKGNKKRDELSFQNKVVNNSSDDIYIPNLVNQENSGVIASSPKANDHANDYDHKSLVLRKRQRPKSPTKSPKLLKVELKLCTSNKQELSADTVTKLASPIKCVDNLRANQDVTISSPINKSVDNEKTVPEPRVTRLSVANMLRCTKNFDNMNSPVKTPSASRKRIDYKKNVSEPRVTRLSIANALLSVTNRDSINSPVQITSRKRATPVKPKNNSKSVNKNAEPERKSQQLDTKIANKKCDITSATSKIISGSIIAPSSSVEKSTTPVNGVLQIQTTDTNISQENNLNTCKMIEMRNDYTIAGPKSNTSAGNTSKTSITLKSTTLKAKDTLGVKSKDPNLVGNKVIEMKFHYVKNSSESEKDGDENSAAMSEPIPGKITRQSTTSALLSLSEKKYDKQNSNLSAEATSPSARRKIAWPRNSNLKATRQNVKDSKTESVSIESNLEIKSTDENKDNLRITRSASSTLANMDKSPAPLFVVPKTPIKYNVLIKKNRKDIADTDGLFSELDESPPRPSRKLLQTSTACSSPPKHYKVRSSSAEFVIRTPRSTPTPTPNDKFRKNSRTKRTIVCTRFHINNVRNFEEIVKKLGYFTTEPNVSEVTTHLVAGGPQRTVNLLRAMARGCWILRKDWLIKSSTAGKWLNEEDYEYLEMNTNVQKCRIEKQMFGSSYCMDVFKDCGIFYVARNSKPPCEDIQELIVLCGGKIMKTLSHRVSVVVGSWVDMEMVVCVNEKWVLDSIYQYKKKPYKPYFLSRRSCSVEI